MKKKPKKWIQKAVPEENKGLLRKKMHAKSGKSISAAKLEKATHSKNAKLRHEAQFAENMRGLKHKGKKK